MICFTVFYKIKYSHPVLPTSCFGFFTFYSRPSSHLLHGPRSLLGHPVDRQCLWERHCRKAPSCRGRATGTGLAGQTQPHPKEKTPMALSSAPRVTTTSSARNGATTWSVCRQRHAQRSRRRRHPLRRRRQRHPARRRGGDALDGGPAATFSTAARSTASTPPTTAASRPAACTSTWRRARPTTVAAPTRWSDRGRPGYRFRRRPHRRPGIEPPARQRRSRLHHRGGGDDSISGGAGKDLILGGSGADKISGGEGEDMLTGGSGADTFQFLFLKRGRGRRRSRRDSRTWRRASTRSTSRSSTPIPRLQATRPSLRRNQRLQRRRPDPRVPAERRALIQFNTSGTSVAEFEIFVETRSRSQRRTSSSDPRACRAV